MLKNVFNEKLSKKINEIDKRIPDNRYMFYYVINMINE